LHSVLGKNKVITYCEDIIDEFINKNKTKFKNYATLRKLLEFNIERLKQ